MRNSFFGRLVGFSAFLFLVQPHLGLVFGEDKPYVPSKKEQKEDAFFQNLERASQLVRVVATGEIVDEDGKPLSAVKVTHFESRNADELNAAFDIIEGKKLASKKEIEEAESMAYGISSVTEIVNQKFIIDMQNIDGIYCPMEFSLDGYYTEIVNCKNHFPHNKELLEKLERIEIPKEIRYGIALKIVLEKKGPATKLASRVFQLQVSTNETGNAVQIGTPKDKPKIEVYPFEKGLKGAPKRSWILEADRDEAKGEFSILKWHPPNSFFEFELPTKIKIKLHGAEGGFIRYIPKDGYDKPVVRKENFFPWKSGKPIARQMKKAPETGYSPELVLDAMELRDSSNSLELVHFFFKVGDTYGRGMAGNPKFSADRKVLTLSLSLEIQPDSTRNLETGE